MIHETILIAFYGLVGGFGLVFGVAGGLNLLSWAAARAEKSDSQSRPDLRQPTGRPVA